MSYQTIIFDLDGTLLDTLRDLQLSVNHTLRQNGFPERSLDEVRQFVGNGAGRLIALSVPEGTDEATQQACLEQFHSHYKLHCNDHTTVYSGLMPVLQQFLQQGKQLAVVSNKPHYGTKALVEQYFPGMVAVTMGQTETLRRKPAPDMVLQVMEQLHTQPDQCVYIGDSDVDIQTAQNAGIPCISVTWGFRSREFLLQHGAVCCIDCPEQLPELIL